MGDHNAPAYDQPLSGAYEPVLPEWIVGKAWGEIPWFGLVKLWVTGGNPAGAPANSWRNLFVTVFVLLLIPFLLDIATPRLKKWRRERKEAKANEKSPEDLPKEELAPESAPPPHQGKNTAGNVVIIKEIVRVPCPYCHVLVENTEVKCPHCGGVIR
jgi:hypothetical protein